MKKIIGFTLMLVAPFLMMVPAAATPPAPTHKVTICHATASESNPYVKINVDIASSGYVKSGHNDHDKDIIPPYTYGDFSFPGKNWPSPIYDNGCKVVESSPTPSATETTASPTPTQTSESPTPTPTPTVTPTVSPTPTVEPTPSPTYPCECGSGTDTKVLASTGLFNFPYAAIALLLLVSGAWFVTAAYKNS